MSQIKLPFKTADLSDDHSDCQYVEPIFYSYGASSQFSGLIRTIKCFEDNSLVRETLATTGDGCVLVVDAGGSKRCAMLGDLLAANAVKNGWSGIIMNGLIRDSVDINSMNIGVRALGTFPLKSIKEGVGKSDLVVKFAGVEFHPGHYVYADEDGIIVSEQALL